MNSAGDLALREALVRYFKETYVKGLNTLMGGNASIRIGGVVYITPSSVPKTELRPEDVVELSVDGSVARGFRAPSSEWRMHIAIYKATKYTAVIHAHPPHILALYTAGLTLNDSPLSELRSYISRIGEVPYLKPGSAELAEAVASEVAKGSDLVVLRNHGAVAVGQTLPEALNKLEVAEDVAKVILLSRCY